MQGRCIQDPSRGQTAWPAGRDKRGLENLPSESLEMGRKGAVCPRRSKVQAAAWRKVCFRRHIFRLHWKNWGVFEVYRNILLFKHYYIFYHAQYFCPMIAYTSRGIIYMTIFIWRTSQLEDLFYNLFNCILGCTIYWFNNCLVNDNSKFKSMNKNWLVCTVRLTVSCEPSLFNCKYFFVI